MLNFRTLAATVALAAIALLVPSTTAQAGQPDKGATTTVQTDTTTRAAQHAWSWQG